MIDVGRGLRAQRSLMNVGLFISLFPQLIAGPIVRYGMIAGQFARPAPDGSAASTTGSGASWSGWPRRR